MNCKHSKLTFEFNYFLNDNQKKKERAPSPQSGDCLRV